MAERFSFSHFFTHSLNRLSSSAADNAHDDTMALAHFIGSWKNHEEGHTVEITNEKLLLFNGNALQGRILSVCPTKLVFQDHFGYHLTMTLVQSDQLLLDDEADEQAYLLYLNNK